MMAVITGCSPAPEPQGYVNSWTVHWIDPRVGWVVTLDGDVPTTLPSSDPVPGGKHLLAFPQAAPRAVLSLADFTALWDTLGRPGRALETQKNLFSPAGAQGTRLGKHDCGEGSIWLLTHNSDSVPPAATAAWCQQKWGEGEKNPF